MRGNSNGAYNINHQYIYKFNLIRTPSQLSGILPCRQCCSIWPANQESTFNDGSTLSRVQRVVEWNPTSSSSVTCCKKKNLRNLMVEIYKCLSCENPSFMWNIFRRKELGYNLRSGSLLMLPQAKTTTYGTSSLTFRGSILWNSLPDAIKSSPSVVYFKRSIKEWKGENCTCKNCC